MRTRPNLEAVEVRVKRVSVGHVGVHAHDELLVALGRHVKDVAEAHATGVRVLASGRGE